MIVMFCCFQHAYDFVGQQYADERQEHERGERSVTATAAAARGECNVAGTERTDSPARARQTGERQQVGQPSAAPAASGATAGAAAAASDTGLSSGDEHSSASAAASSVSGHNDERDGEELAPGERRRRKVSSQAGHFRVSAQVFAAEKCRSEQETESADSDHRSEERPVEGHSRRSAEMLLFPASAPIAR